MGKQATVEVATDGGSDSFRQVLPVDEVDWRRSSASFVAVSSELMAFAPPVFDVVWRRPAGGPVHRASDHLILDVILDLDAFGDRLLIVGGRRGDDGTYLPDGAFAWLAETSDGRLQLNSVYFRRGAGKPGASSSAV